MAREIDSTQIPPKIVSEAPARHADVRAHALPADWQPADDDIAWAAKARPDIDRTALDAETERFRLHASANGRTAHHWGANWRLWVSKAHAGQKAEPARTAGDFDEDWPARMRGYRPGRFWNPMWGPRPESGQSYVPAPILAAWKESMT